MKEPFIEKIRLKCKCNICGTEATINCPTPENHLDYRKIRQSTNLSVRDVARKLKVSPTYISDIELGKRLGNEKIRQFYKGLVSKDEKLSINTP